MRHTKNYFADFRRAIRDYYHPGDQLRLVRQYREARKCEMCGGMVDIKNCYDLRNLRSGKVIVCGQICIARFADVVVQMGQTPSIVFHQEFHGQAAKINEQPGGTVVVEFEEDVEFHEEVEPEEDPASRDEWSLKDLIGQPPRADDLDYEDALAQGLDPDEIDWESHDYE
jgi:hypothetical protein